MAEEFEIKPNKEQEKREQAKRDLAELQNLLEPEEEEDEEFDPEELEEDEDDAEESSETESDTQADETQAENEESASSTKTEEPKSEQELEEQRQADREQAEREAMLEQQIRRKQTEKALAEMKEKQQAEQAKAQQEQAAAEKAAQPKPQKKPVQKKPVQKKKQPAESKPRKTHRDAKLARKHRRQLVRMGTVLVVALVALVLIVSAVRGITGGSNKQDNTKGNKTTTSTVTNEDTNTPASQQETKQYLKIKDDTSLPAYAKEYPGLYATAATTQKKLSDKKVCYLTFDDGPSDTCTPKILDTLKKYNVKATFFVVTSEIDGNEKLIQRIIDEGHTLCIHANEHEYQKIYASPEAYLKDFAAAYDKIYALTGYKVQGFRFPGGSNGQLKHYGNYDAIIKEMNRRGFEYYDWNAYDHDAEGGNYSAAELAQYAVHEVSISSRNDIIVLLHDTYGKENTVKALPSIIEGIQKQGIECLPITKTTRPVHFSVNENTPAEYTEETKDSTKSSDSSSKN